MGDKSGVINSIQGGTLIDMFGNSSIQSKIRNYFTGIFEATDFNNWRNSPNFDGVMFWFCYGKFRQGNNEELYLAIEPKYNFDYPKQDPTRAKGLVPEYDQLIIPLEIKGKVLNGNSGIQILQGERGRPNSNNQREGKDSILRKVHRFLSDVDFWQYNKYGHGFFEADLAGHNYFEQLLGSSNQSPTYVRYYFGFDDNHHPNKIRFFLVPVDSNGDNILTLHKSHPKMELNNSYLLQYSWPPPPQN